MELICTQRRKAWSTFPNIRQEGREDFALWRSGMPWAAMKIHQHGELGGVFSL